MFHLPPMMCVLQIFVFPNADVCVCQGVSCPTEGSRTLGWALTRVTLQVPPENILTGESNCNKNKQTKTMTKPHNKQTHLGAHLSDCQGCTEKLFHQIKSSVSKIGQTIDQSSGKGNSGWK